MALQSFRQESSPTPTWRFQGLKLGVSSCHVDALLLSNICLPCLPITGRGCQSLHHPFLCITNSPGIQDSFSLPSLTVEQDWPRAQGLRVKVRLTSQIQRKIPLAAGLCKPEQTSEVLSPFLFPPISPLVATLIVG